jgi:hypothetical protein
MKASPLPRKTANLSESIHQQLSMYALAASAAGVGALCFAKPAEARIVYTAAHVAIKANGGLFRIDLDHDGTPDFGLSNKWTHSTTFSFRTLSVRQSQSPNEMWMTNSKECGGILAGAAALPKGKRIGPKGEFNNPYRAAVMAAATKATTCGVWAGQSNLQAYLGLKFTIKGKIHFGWARVKVDTQQRPFSATLTGYAYETIPGKAIIAGATKGPDDDAQPVPATHTSPAPKPATLGMLALGAPGLSAWRREETLAATSDRN